MKWHLLSGEYPPNCGGVGGYTANLAAALAAAGEDVDVWVGDPETGRATSPFGVHVLPDRFGPRSRAVLAEAFDRVRGVVLLQYVPNALGAKGVNLAFCRWLRGRRRAGDDIRVMFHEPYMYFSLRRPALSALALAQRVMATTLIKASTQIYYSTDRWADYLGSFGAAGAITLPIPSTITARPSPPAVAEFRRAFARTPAPVIGHFGTYGTDVANELLPAVMELSRRRPLNLALLGQNSGEFSARLASSGAPATMAISATGRLDDESTAAALAACDLLIQPYPDGVTTRRTSLMAGLALGIPIISTTGFLTERLWSESAAAMLVAAGDSVAIATAAERLIDSRAERFELGERGRTVYTQHLSMDVTLRRLRRVIESAA